MQQRYKGDKTTIEEARAQAIWLKIRSSREGNKEEEIKKWLSIYYPEWTKEQIESEQQLLFELAKSGTNTKALLEERFKKVKKEREKRANP